MTFFDIADMSPPDAIELELSAEPDFIVPLLSEDFEPDAALPDEPEDIVSVLDDELPDPDAPVEPDFIEPLVSDDVAPEPEPIEVCMV